MVLVMFQLPTVAQEVIKASMPIKIPVLWQVDNHATTYTRWRIVSNGILSVNLPPPSLHGPAWALHPPSGHLRKAAAFNRKPRNWIAFRSKREKNRMSSVYIVDKHEDQSGSTTQKIECAANAGFWTAGCFAEPVPLMFMHAHRAKQSLSMHRSSTLHLSFISCTKNSPNCSSYST